MGIIPVLLEPFNTHGNCCLHIRTLAVITSDELIKDVVTLVGKHSVTFFHKPVLYIEESTETLLNFVTAHKNENSIEGYLVKTITFPTCMANTV